ncbi:MAG: outer membrane beta-barrel protein [Candidatus Kapabacteria bacterium]|nr:outer membrane beta-barrel protein [Candidatus Kapabacteria bacterium]
MKLYIILFLSIANFAFAESFSVVGKVTDSTSKEPLIGATALLINLGTKDSTKTGKFSDKKGNFEFENVDKGKYLLKISYIGYKTYSKNIFVNKDLNLGNLFLQVSEIEGETLEVTATATVGTQRGDTTEYNAGNIKSQPDANAEDVVKKLPGVQLDVDGKLKAQGEEVKKVLVDGKQFFGDDPTLTLRSLPADIIDKVQVFDKWSDQSEFTGFDDGNSSKALNIITKKNKRVGRFGKAYAGYGTLDRYNAGLNFNNFNGDQRISVLGNFNNINQQNFAVTDILDMIGTPGGAIGNAARSMAGRFAGAIAGGGGDLLRRIGGGGGGGPISDYFVGNMDGITNTDAVGINYNDAWSDHIDVQSSYFFNYTHNNNNQQINRDYFLTGSSTFLNSNYSIPQSNTKNYNHRFNLKLTWQIDSSNSIIFRPAGNFQTSDKLNDNYSYNYITGLPTSKLNSTDNNTNSDYRGANASAELLLRHRFDIPGRTISLSLNGSFNDKTGSSDIQNVYNFYIPTSVVDSINELANTPSNGKTYSANTVYTEPITKDIQLQANYTLSYNINNSDKETNLYDTTTKKYDILDSLLTNKFENHYLTNNAGFGFRLKSDSLNITFMLNGRRTELTNEQQMPVSPSINKTYNNLIPSLRLAYKLGQGKNLNIFYRTNANIPSIKQLQNVLDNSDPTNLSVGNPNLLQSYSHSGMIRYTDFSSDFTRILMFFANFSLMQNYIGNETVFSDVNQTIDGKYLVPAGTHFAKPVNLNGFYSASSFITYGFPITLIGSNVNLTAGGIFARTPSIYNKIQNYSNTYSPNLLIVLASNISKDLDFNISSRTAYNATTNSLQDNLNNNYISYFNTINFKWVVWQGLFFQIEMKNQIYSGKDAPKSNNFTLLNLSAGKRLLNDAAELKLTLYDALNENKSVSTTVSDHYLEYAQNYVLKQYIMLTFTYNLKLFGSGSPIGGGMFPGMGGFKPRD